MLYLDTQSAPSPLFLAIGRRHVHSLGPAVLLSKRARPAVSKRLDGKVTRKILSAGGNPNLCERS